MRYNLLSLLLAVTLTVLVYADTAQAHLAYEGTSDGPDIGTTIQLYKVPGTRFEGQFMRARQGWNSVEEAPDFQMVRDPAVAEVIIFKQPDTVCRGEMLKWSAYVDTAMATSECHGELLHAVWLHELGHVLDLEHHPCDDYSSVMNECARVNLITSHDLVSLR